MRPIKRKQHTGSTRLVQEPWSLFKTPRSGPGASGRRSLPSALRSTKSPRVAAGCRRPQPRVNGGRWRRLARADPASRAGVSCWRCFCPTWTQRREDRPFAAGEVCRAVLLHELATLRRGRELRFRKLRVLNFAMLQVRPRSGLRTGRELAAPRSSLSKLGHLTANRRSHRLRRRHKAQDALVSGGSGGPGGGVLARRRRVR